MSATAPDIRRPVDPGPSVTVPGPSATPSDLDAQSARQAVRALGALIGRGPSERYEGLGSRTPAPRGDVLEELAHLARFIALAAGRAEGDVAHHAQALAAALDRSARRDEVAAPTAAPRSARSG